MPSLALVVALLEDAVAQLLGDRLSSTAVASDANFASLPMRAKSDSNVCRTFGYWILIATSWPRSTPRCTCPMDAAATGVSSMLSKSSETGAPSEPSSTGTSDANATGDAPR